MLATTSFTIYSWLLFLFTSMLLFMATYAFRRRNNPVAQYFSLFLLAAAFYSGGYSFEIASNSIQDVDFWVSIEFIGIAYLPTFILLMVYGYVYQRFCHFTLTLFLVLLSTITLVVQLGNYYHHLNFTILHLVKINGLSIAQVSFGPWYFFHMLYVHLSVLITLIVFYRSWRTTKSYYRLQALCVIGGVSIPWIGYFLFVLGVAPYNLDPTPFLFVFSIPLFMYGFFRFHLLDLPPIGREQVFDSFEDAVLIINQEHRIVDFNARAANLFPELNQFAFGQSAFSVISIFQDVFHENIICNKTIRLKEKYYEVLFHNLKRKNEITIGGALVFRDITERQCLLEQLKHHAEIDSLTGILNRRIILGTLEKQLYNVSLDTNQLSVILFDLDYFKHLNDTEGHLSGDSKLKQLAQLISCEIREHDSIGRYGGDEFLLILPDTNIETALSVAKRLNVLCHEHIGMTLSMGVSTYSVGDSASDLIQKADKALYLAKNSGRAQACTFDISDILPLPDKLSPHITCPDM